MVAPRAGGWRGARSVIPGCRAERTISASMAKPPLLTRAFALASVANFMHSLAFHSYLHLPGFLRERTDDDFVIGVTVGAMALSAILFRPWLGRLIDTRGRRAIVVAGGALNIVFSALYLTVDTVGPWLMFVRVGHGLAEGALFSVLFTVAADLVPAERRAEGMALFGVSGMIPLSLAGLAGDFILSRGTYDDLFIFTIGCAVVGSLAGWALHDSAPPKTGDAPPTSFLRAATRRSLRPLWVAGFAFAFALASYFAFLKTLVIDRGVGSMGGFFTAYTIAAVALRVGLGWVPDRVGPRRVLIPAMLVTGIGVVVLAFGRSATAFIVAGVLCGIGHGYAFPITSSMVVERAPASERGMALAAFTALFDLGLLVGAPTLGFVLESSSYEVMFTAAGAVVIFGAIFYGVWDTRITALPDAQDAECLDPRS